MMISRILALGLASVGIVNGMVVPHSLSKLNAGSTKPIENFDPLRLCNDERANFFREAELKHGRLAMASSVAFPVIETMTNKAALHQFEDLPDMVQGGIVSAMIGVEFASMLKGWETPFGENKFAQPLRVAVRKRQRTGMADMKELGLTSTFPDKTRIYVPGKPFSLREDYQPGDFGFGLKSKDDIDLQNKELNNGRLAMFGMLGMMGQELMTNQPIF